jgi:DNA-binding MarR family transcriptional regulator
MPSSTMPVRSEAGLASALRISVMRLSRRLRNQRAADHQLSANQLGVMATLNRHGLLTIGEIAGHEKVRPPSTTRTVTSLEELGLVVREPHPSDRRQVLVRLADEGRRILAEDRKRRDAWLARRLHELSPEEKEILRSAAPILERLAAS